MAQKYDLIIVGGGIMASSLAYNLRKDGYTGSIVVFEKDRMYEYSSTPRSYGGVRHTFSIEGNIRLSQLSIKLYEKFERDMALDGEPAVIDFKQHGYLYLANDKGLPMLKDNMKLQTSLGANIQLMTPEEVKSFVPELKVDDLAGGIFDVDGGNIDPYSVLQWYAKHAKRLGVEYIYEKVQAILSDGSRITGVKLESGEEYHAPVVVNAAGAWSGEISKTAGLDIPVVPLRKQVYCIDLAEPFNRDIPFVFDTVNGTYFQGEGLKVITGSREGSNLVEKQEDSRYDYNFQLDKSYFTDEVWPLLAERSPSFERVKLEQGWAGLYEYNYIDHNAIIGEHPQVKGYHLLTGFSGHGFQQAPAAGKGLSELIRRGKYETIDLTPFSLERFAKNELLLEKEVY
ncbi:FAD-binding oxidoreductase [Paradesulfitobacterium aromaticivorans]